MAGVEAELASAADDTRALARGEAGVLRLLHSSSVPLAGPLLAALGRFNRDVPAARVDLDRVASETQVAEVAAGRADVGVARLPVLRRDPAVEFVPLPDERLLVALPAGHRFEAQPALQLADLAGEAFVSAVHRERGGLARRVTDLCLARGFVPRMAPVISRKTSMLTLVGAGFGVAVIPAGMAGLAGDGVRLVPLVDADATAAAAILLPRQPSPLAARFAGICRAAWAAGEDGA
jgi:DNA-binding transcriptional LysR family regulator